MSDHCSAPEAQALPHAILITGEPGWLSGACPGPVEPSGLLASYADRWEIDAQQVPAWYASRRRGTETRVLVAFSVAELASKLAAIESADGAAPPAAGGPGGA